MTRIAGAIAALDPLPDIVCLQEVETTSLRSTVAHRGSLPEETQLARLMIVLEQALAAAGKREGYDAYRKNPLKAKNARTHVCGALPPSCTSAGS